MATEQVIEVSELKTNGKMTENGVSEEENTDSCVLHLRRLPQDVTDSEVAYLTIPFGGLSNMVITKKTGQALIEMPSLDAAKAMLKYYVDVAKPILRRPTGLCEVAMQYSRYQKLSTNGGSTQLYAAINQANEQALTASENGPRCVLRVQVECYPFQVPLSHTLFYQIFSRFGALKRIIAFMGRRGVGSPQPLIQPQALIEFESPVSAHVAKLQMHQCPFSALGGHLLVDFSRQETLEVRHENTLCRDFVQRPMTDVELLSIGMSGLCCNEAPMYHPPGAEYSWGYPPQRQNGRGLMMPQPVPLMAQPTAPPPDPRLFLPPNASPVLIVSQLNTEKVVPDVLFNLFGVFGDVVRVKVMFSKRDTALVQFVDASQASLALENLSGCPLYGRALQVNFSRHLHIKMPPASAAEEGMTKDYADCGLHRFRRAASARQAIYAPSCVLHVSGLPTDATQEEITEAFVSRNHSPLQTKLMQKEDRKTALVQFSSLEEAVTALVDVHNQFLRPQELPESDGVNRHRLRVCFSRINLPPPS